jgi:dipeptidyl aminopeptidase/acylaminoacyl peptidase
MKRYFILYFFAILFGCKQVEMVNNEEGMVDAEKFVMWTASPKATIDDGMVLLNWSNSSIYDKILLPYEWVHPDKFEIYFSKNNMSAFQKLIELNNDTGCSYTVNELQNGEPYFFYVVSKKKGYKSLTSDTIMAVPNKRNEFETLLTIDGENIRSLGNVSIAHQKNKIAFDANYFWGEEGENCCLDGSVLLSNMDGSEKELVNINSFCPSWSPSNDKIVFNTLIYVWENGRDWISQIALYDCETKSITQLTEGKEHNFAPVFSKNGDLILFQSTKNTPEAYKTTDETNIWLLNLITFESIQITDISKTSLQSAERPNWIDNDRFLFHGIYHGKLFEEKRQLFTSSISTKQITKVFDSQWNDHTPSISPNKKKIAFYSNRSGTSQIWIYNIDSKNYHQITGFSDLFCIPGSHIEWLDDATIIHPMADNQYKLVKQSVE